MSLIVHYRCAALAQLVRAREKRRKRNGYEHGNERDGNLMQQVAPGEGAQQTMAIFFSANEVLLGCSVRGQQPVPASR